MQDKKPLDLFEIDLLGVRARAFADEYRPWYWVATVDLFCATDTKYNGKRGFSFVPDYWLRKELVPGDRGQRLAWFAAEPGALQILARSRSPRAFRVYRHVHENAEQIRLLVSEPARLSHMEECRLTDRLIKVTDAVRGSEGQERDIYFARLQQICGKLRLPPPNLVEICGGRDHG